MTNTEIEPTATYALFHIDNLRTGAMHQYAILDGTGVTKVLANSTEPRRIVARKLPELGVENVVVTCLSCEADVFGGSELCATCQDDDEAGHRYRW